jgi:hypothetical protein
MRIKTGILAIAFGTLVSAGGFVAGCSDDPATTTDSGTPTSTTTTTTPTSTSTADGSTPTTTLFERLGKKDGISKAVDAIIAAEAKDADVISYFFFQNLPSGPPAANHPSLAQVRICLINQLVAVSGGDDKAYPGVPADNEGWQCRDMKTSHATLNIPSGIFDKFVTIAAGVLKSAGVADADIAIIGGVLNGTKGAIVTPGATEGPFKPPSDAGPG